MSVDPDKAAPANDSLPRIGPPPEPAEAGSNAGTGAPAGRTSARDRRPADLIEFQPDALEVEEKSPSGPARMTLYSVAAFLISAVTWAALSEVDQVVTAEGRMINTSSNLVVQALETAVIRSMEVQPGDVVRAGSRLATLDPTVSAADVSQLTARLASLSARLDRLTAEMEERAYVPAGDSGPEIRLQADIFRQRQSQLDAQLRRYVESLAEMQATLATNRADQTTMAGRLEVLSEIEGMRAELLASNTGSRLNLLEARQMRLDLEGGLERLRRQEVEIGHRSEALKAERDSFVEDFRRRTLEELVQVRDEYRGVADELSKAKYRQQMVALTAPADGMVLEVAERSVGSVLREAEPLVTLVPLDAPLEAEVAVTATDIGLISVGQPVRLKLAAFPFQKYGTAVGRVRVISGDAFAPADGVPQPPFYKVRVEIEDLALRNLPEAFRLLPGMTVSAEIRTGERTVLSYFLYPLLRGLDESVREP